MTLEKETLDLAARHERDLAAVKTAKAERHAQDLAEQKRRLEHEAAQAKRADAIHALEAAARESGSALAAIEATVPPELVTALDAAGRDVRAVEARAAEARRALSDADDQLAAAKKTGDKGLVRSAEAARTSALVTVSTVAEQLRRAQARLEVARKAREGALEAARAGR